MEREAENCAPEDKDKLRRGGTGGSKFGGGPWQNNNFEFQSGTSESSHLRRERELSPQQSGNMDDQSNRPHRKTKEKKKKTHGGRVAP